MLKCHLWFSAICSMKAPTKTLQFVLSKDEKLTCTNQWAMLWSFSCFQASEKLNFLFTTEVKRIAEFKCKTVNNSCTYITSTFYEYVYLPMLIVGGCADLSTPKNAWHTRSGDVATIGCNTYNKTWQLQCQGSQWTGVMGSCNATGWYPCISYQYTHMSH